MKKKPEAPALDPRHPALSAARPPFEKGRLARCLEAIEAPCAPPEETLLRAEFIKDYPGQGAKARALVEAVERIGLEPFQAPAPLPPIRVEDVHLVCWLAIESKLSLA